MTQREFYRVIAEGKGNISYNNENGNLNYKDITIDAPEIKEFAKAAIEKLNARNSARKAKVDEVNVKFYEELTQKIIDALEVGKEYTATEIAGIVNEKPGKVTFALTKLADEGKITKTKPKKSKPYVYVVNG